MGTDVHGFVEYNAVEFSDIDQWTNLMEIGLMVERDYDVFGLLFGQRKQSDAKPISTDRGIPLDCSDKAALVGLHSQTWVMWEEIAPYVEQFHAHEGWVAVFAVMKRMHSLCGNKHVRLVVGFDN